MMNIRISEVKMSDSDYSQNNLAMSRKPRVSTTIDRREAVRLAGETSATRKSDIVVKRTTHEQQKQPQVKKMTAQEIKRDAIEKALADVAKKDTVKKKEHTKVHFGFKRVLLALTCSAIAVGAIVYFVNLNVPDFSLKVAAMQTGIEASYPSYVPRDFHLSDITSEDGKIILNFKNSASGETFSLTEEKSSWDSNALLNNFVKAEFGEDYTVIKEQGLTLYMGTDTTVWINRGIIYNLHAASGSLTKKQITNIAVHCGNA